MCAARHDLRWLPLCVRRTRWNGTGKAGQWLCWLTESEVLGDHSSVTVTAYSQTVFTAGCCFCLPLAFKKQRVDECLISLAVSGRVDPSTCGLITHLPCPSQSNCPFISASVCSRKGGEDASRHSLIIDSSLRRPNFLTVPWHVCSGPNSIPQCTIMRVSPGMLMKEASLWVTHELCGYWLEDTLVLYVPDHQSKQSDRLGHNASSVHFIFALFTYLCGQLRRMITVMAKAHSDIFSLCFSPPDTSVMLLSCKQEDGVPTERCVFNQLRM